MVEDLSNKINIIGGSYFGIGSIGIVIYSIHTNRLVVILKTSEAEMVSTFRKKTVEQRKMRENLYRKIGH